MKHHKSIEEELAEPMTLTEIASLVLAILTLTAILLVAVNASIA